MSEIVSEEAKATLKDMGLTEYEIRAYTYLLKSGLSTASQISENANIPYSKIYEVLNSLEHKGWIKSQGGRPRLYYPKSPREALEETKLRMEDRVRVWQKTVFLELQPIYEKRGVREKPDIWIFRSLSDAIAKLKEMLGSAEREVLVAVPKDMYQIIDAVLPMLRNVCISRAKLLLMLSGGGNFPDKFRSLGEVRFRDEMFGGGIIVDGREVMLMLGEPKQSIILWSNHLDLVRFAKDYFQHLWEGAHKVQISNFENQC
ncbi:TrmB family transcriptional regulator [Candidatus Bathyarchaeota archaeon]|nr:TrmB family transcriptional regulator [Candidatus Bathyarchaeota archaeon]